MEPLSLQFGAVARALAEAARAHGLTKCPAYRSPPGLAGVSRSIRRRRDGGVTVSVALRGRPWAAVLADMIDGVVVANRLRGRAADQARTALWVALAEAGATGSGDDLPVAAGPAATSGPARPTRRAAAGPAEPGESGRGASQAA